MRSLPMTLACLVMLAAPAAAFAAPAFPAGIARGAPAIMLVQDKPKGETVTQKVKRAWKNLVGYQFDVACLGKQATCSETGDSRGAAQAKCIAKNPLCWVTEKK